MFCVLHLQHKLKSSQRDKVKKFIAITQTDEQTATAYLQRNDWKLDQASDNYFQQPQTYYNDLDQKKVEQLFQRYADRDEPAKITMDGVCHFLEDLQLDPSSKLVLIIAWKFRAEKQCEFTRTEFVNGFVQLGIDSIDSLRSKLPSLEIELRDPNIFKDFYHFTSTMQKRTHKKVSTWKWPSPTGTLCSKVC